jgi:hypothetical protein
MRYIFNDLEALALEMDPSHPGVLFKARKPENFIEMDLSDIALYSIISNKRVKNIEEKDFESLLYYRIVCKQEIQKFIVTIWKHLFNLP